MTNNNKNQAAGVGAAAGDSSLRSAIVASWLASSLAGPVRAAAISEAGPSKAPMISPIASRRVGIFIATSSEMGVPSATAVLIPNFLSSFGFFLTISFSKASTALL